MLKKVFKGLVILALMVLVVWKADTISGVGGALGDLVVAVAVAVLAAAFILIVVLPLLGLIFAGASFIILLILLAGAISIPFAIFTGHRADQDMSGITPDSGPVVGEVRDMPRFDKINVTGNLTILVVNGGGHAVALKGVAKDIKALRTTVTDGVLNIEPVQPTSFNRDLRVAVSATGLNGVKIAGTTRASLQKIASPSFNLDLDGAGQVEVAGTCGVGAFHLSGAGSLNAKAFKCENVEIALEGAAIASVHATKSLKAKVNGIGRIVYAGNPAKVTRDVSGLGMVSPE